MNKKEAKARILKLVDSINHHRYLYHVLDRQEISDAALDTLKHELATLEGRFPQFVTLDSPTQRVGGAPLPKFEKVKHVVSQWSFNDAFDEQEMRDFEARVTRLLQGKKPTYVCELKIDGFKIVLTYQHGILITAATRGDGTTGENVTANVRTIESVPLRLERPVDVIVEGEIWLSRKDFESLNKQQEKEGKPLYANPRNVAAGTIRQLDPTIVAARNLESFAYDIAPISNLNNFPDTRHLGNPRYPAPGGQGRYSKGIETQVEELELLSQLGFRVNKHYRVCATIEEVIEYWRKWQKRKDAEAYWIDGVVVKVNERVYQEQLGYTGKAPRFGIAFKFRAEQGTSVIESIGLQVGRSGVLTPVAHLRPVSLAGTTVARATLHNEDEIKRLGLKIGDTVVLEKAGDVIPRVLTVLTELRTGKELAFVMPKKCPVCQGPVLQDQGLVARRCVNPHCFARERRRLYYFASKVALDIDGLGPRILDTLIDNHLVVYPADLFKLKKEELVGLPGFALKSADNLLAAITKARRVELARFLIALGIPQVGEETAYALARQFGSFVKLRRASRDDLLGVFGIGEVVADAILAFFKDTEQRKIVDALLLCISVQPQPLHLEGAEGKKLMGQSFVLTGTLSGLTRAEAKQKIRALGGDVASAVSQKTDYLVVGADPGSKHQEAKRLGVKIVDEQEFLKLVEA